jgi:hypothetical protein
MAEGKGEKVMSVLLITFFMAIIGFAAYGTFTGITSMGMPIILLLLAIVVFVLFKFISGTPNLQEFMTLIVVVLVIGGIFYFSGDKLLTFSITPVPSLDAVGKNVASIFGGV